MLRPVLLFCLSLAMLAAAHGGQAHRFDPARDAAADVAAAVALARKEGKRVLVEVGGEWCPWCHILDRFMKDEAEVRGLRDEAYVTVKVNFSPANRNQALLSRWPAIGGYPHLFVLDDSGAVVRSQPSAELEAGKTYDRRRMMDFLRQHRRP